MREDYFSRFIIPISLNHVKHKPLDCTGDAGLFQWLRVPCIYLQDSTFRKVSGDEAEYTAHWTCSSRYILLCNPFADT